MYPCFKADDASTGTNKTLGESHAINILSGNENLEIPTLGRHRDPMKETRALVQAV